MDLPLFLETGNYISGRDEFRQNLLTMLKFSLGEFLQSNTVGSFVSIHTQSDLIIREAVIRTVNQISGLEVESCETIGEEVHLSIKYRGNIENYIYSYNELG